MSGHTQGPWELIHFGDPQIGNKASGEAVCTMWGDENDPADPFHANARLIAAAPDLYEALEELVAFTCEEGVLNGKAAKAIKALSKARGDA